MAIESREHSVGNGEDGAHKVRAATNQIVWRSDLKAARISEVKSSGCSHAAK
jgi:hypothetical protein